MPNNGASAVTNVDELSEKFRNSSRVKSAMAVKHKQNFRTVKRVFVCFAIFGAGLERQMHLQVRVQEVLVTCPSCRSEKEMLFLVLSLSFICDEPQCGYEVQVDPQEAEILLQPEEKFVFA